jgi:pilus assembly protein Flp/PilA
MDSLIPQTKMDLTDESGVTAIEYALLAALIAVAIIGAVAATGTSLGAMYTTWSTAVINSIAGAL